MAPIMSELRGTVQRFFERRRVQGALKAAIEAAFRRFAEEHPDWANERYFDRTFLAGGAAPLLARFLNRGEMPTAEEFAARWRQYGLRIDGSARDIAADFLRLFKEEVRGQQPLQLLIDRQVWDAAADTLADIAARLTEAELRWSEEQRQRTVQGALDRLSEAAAAYVEAGREYRPGVHTGDLTFRARHLAAQAASRLRQTRSARAAEIIEAFQRLVADRIDALVEARDAGGNGRYELDLLQAGALEFEDYLPDQ